MANQGTNIFISYGRKDSRDLALKLRDDLMSVGYSVWLDTNEIPGGADWSAQIEVAIEHCHIMLALLSPASYESQWCRAEQLRATRKGKRLIPLLAVQGAEVPLHLEHMNYLDFTDKTNYLDMLRDLLSDITAGIAFISPTPSVSALGQGGGMAGLAAPSPYKQSKITGRNKDEKRTAAAYRRVLRQLRQEDWLGARFWWPYFLFYYTDLQSVINILSNEEVLSPVNNGDSFNSRWDRNVSLYFRPRTPDLFFAEGFRSSLNRLPRNYASIPVYLLFDFEALILQPDARFADGDPAKTKKTYKTPAYFRDLPFEQIYHDSWFLPDEREEIMRYRESQVLIPERLGLEALQLIWVRSPAEYETLQNLMPDPVWHKWREKITARTDYHLFNNKRTYVQNVSLEPQQIRIRFNQCQVDCQAFLASVTVTYEDGETVKWQQDQFNPDDDLVINLPKSQPYSVQLSFDEDVAYAGKFAPEVQIL